MTQGPDDRYRSPFLPPREPPRPGEDGGKPVTTPAKPLSALLVEIAEDESRERISIADLVRAMHLRAIGALLLIFALPNAVPTPPGTSAILGLPLLYLTWQLMLGQTPWLPRFISDRSMGRADFASLIGKISPMLARAEKLLTARMPALTTPTAERIVGGLCLVLAAVLFLPIPLGNMLPAFAISVIALGILERDGLWILAGSIIGLVSLVIVSGVVWALVRTVGFLLANVFAG